MIEINETIYKQIAALLLAEIGEKDYFNGTIEYDTDEFLYVDHMSGSRVV